MTDQERDAVVRDTIARCADVVRDTPAVFVRNRLDAKATLEQAAKRVMKLSHAKAWYE